MMDAFTLPNPPSRFGSGTRVVDVWWKPAPLG